MREPSPFRVAPGDVGAPPHGTQSCRVLANGPAALAEITIVELGPLIAAPSWANARRIYGRRAMIS